VNCVESKEYRTKITKIKKGYLFVQNKLKRFFGRAENLRAKPWVAGDGDGDHSLNFGGIRRRGKLRSGF